MAIMDLCLHAGFDKIYTNMQEGTRRQRRRRGGNNVEQSKIIPELLDYWKDYVTLHNVLACELSYSLIYNNIRPDKVGDALATVGLDTLPNRFMLIQVDDYYNYSSKMHITREFFQKLALINLLRECMDAMGVTGFVANLVGLDKLVCFLCCQDWEDADINAHLLKVAEAFKNKIRTRSAYTISLCISQRCSRLGQYSLMYPRMDLALNKSYFSGKEFSILLKDVEQGMKKQEEADLNKFYPEMLAAFTRRNREQLECVLQEMMRALLEGQTRPQKAKMEMIRLMQRIGDYCVRCGTPEDWMQRRSDTAMSRILSCSFLADTRLCFLELYDEVIQVLTEYVADNEYAFKIPVSEYIDTHYMENIRVGYLANMMGFSEGHFARIFRKEFGMTFVQYLTERRIQRSKELLSDTCIPIEQIAYRVGLNSYSYFCTCFKRSCGMSPGAFRAGTIRREGSGGAEYQGDKS